MDNIHIPNSTFAFDKLILTKPTSVPGGNYFIKFRFNDKPLYIQSPKCSTKQGIQKAGKRFLTDLMFNNENEEFIQWMENLENYSQKYIYQHRTEWFETDLEIHDIENSFAPLLKIYKSGKYYLARANVPAILGKCTLKIYDEHENEVEPDAITHDDNVITILEMQGIKCSARSFQIEIEIKQMLVLKPEKIFEKCLLTKEIKTMTHPVETFSNNESLETKKSDEDSVEEIIIDTPDRELVSFVSTETTEPAAEESPEETEIEQPISFPTEDKVFSHNLEESTEPIEVEFNLDDLNTDDTIQLKNRNDVYYKMYREARKKAKMAKDLALASYLEAKRIKNTYMLEDIQDSDLDSDLEEN
jgi:hypothetical protein